MKRKASGFTLLEVMVAVAILAIALGAVFSSEAGAVKMATRARKMGWASLLVRCKMGEIEEQIAKEGFPALFDEGEDNCCAEAEIEGYTCKWEIEPVSMPDTMFESEEGEGEGSAENDGDPKTSKTDTKLDSKAVDAKTSQKEKREDLSEVLKDPKKLLGGGSAMMGNSSPFGGGSDSEGEGAPDMDAIASMAMQYVYPILKPSFESQIRRATVTVKWKEGSAEQSFDVTQYLVAEQPIKLPDGTDPNAQNQTGTGTGTGTSTGTGNKPSTFGTTGTSNNPLAPGLFAPRTNLP
ncbi:MAG TPA: prepilin-type N-terminal cleavage/methylation domain-containing protein [Polyangiales bacterium]|nr:prepilin-type N-terminal cleavage/methylation domain-containing protein [Polyangiales bacterium]